MRRTIFSPQLVVNRRPALHSQGQLYAVVRIRLAADDLQGGSSTALAFLAEALVIALRDVSATSLEGAALALLAAIL